MRLPEPIVGRECGSCTVCCIELAINDPALQKADGIACPHMMAAKGCAIHARAPVTCQTWFCGWRFLHLSDAMRPDRSHVMLVPELAAVPGFARGGLKIVLVGGDKAALFRDELVDFIAKCVLGEVPVFLSWGDGAFAKRYLINDDCAAAARGGDKKKFISMLRQISGQMAREVAFDAGDSKTRL